MTLRFSVAVRRASLTAAPLDPDRDDSGLLGAVVTWVYRIETRGAGLG